LHNKVQNPSRHGVRKSGHRHMLHPLLALLGGVAETAYFKCLGLLTMDGGMNESPGILLPPRQTSLPDLHACRKAPFRFCVHRAKGRRASLEAGGHTDGDLFHDRTLRPMRSNRVRARPLLCPGSKAPVYGWNSGWCCLTQESVRQGLPSCARPLVRFRPHVDKGVPKAAEFLGRGFRTAAGPFPNSASEVTNRAGPERDGSRPISLTKPNGELEPLSVQARRR